MKKLLLLLVAALACFALPLTAQEKEKAKDAAAAMTPPPPLKDDMCSWMLGEWEGWSTTSMGKMKDWMKVEMGLDGQFLLTEYTGQMAEMTEDQKMKAMKDFGMTKEDLDKMMQMPYKGRGPMTIDPATGEYMGYWFDNWRGVYKGSGKRDGNKITMTWEGPMGTEMRTTEKVSDDKMVISFKSLDPTGNTMNEGKSELTRKKSMMK